MQLRSPKAQMLQLQFEEFKAKLDKIFLLAKSHRENHRSPDYKMPIEFKLILSGKGSTLIKDSCYFFKAYLGRSKIHPDAGIDEIITADSDIDTLLKYSDTVDNCLYDLDFKIQYIKMLFSSPVASVAEQLEIEFAKALEKDPEQKPQIKPTSALFK